MNFHPPVLIRGSFAAARRAFLPVALSCLAAVLPGPLHAQSPAPEMRAIWVSRFEWPSSNIRTAKNNIDQIMADIASNNFNTVLFQVRGQCDTHYPSPDEPWTNTYGWQPPMDPDNPGQVWDPLAYAIQAAHAHGLEFHAYINTHTLAGPVPPANTTPQHPLNIHGPNAPGEQSWMIRNSSGVAGAVDSYYWISPANTEASAWTRRQILYIVKNYDVDGVHFDRIRSPGNSYTYDAATQRRWNSGQVSDSNPDGLTLGDFMRSQITRDLRKIQGEILYYKPWVKTSAAPFGIVYKDSTTQYQGNGTQSHHSWFQDSWGWLRYHTLDFMVPQIYWEVGSAHPFEKLLQDWMAHTGGRHVVAGSTTGSGNKSVSALLAEHAQTRLQGAHGHCIFSYGSMGSYWSPFKTQRYDQPTTVPEMPWKTNPTVGTITGYVVDAAGNPVVDAKINLAGDIFQNPQGGPYNYLSAHDGFFAILDVTPGSSHQITASKTGVGSRVASGLSVSAGGVTSITLVLTQSQGVLTFDRQVYPGSATARLSLVDGDLAGQTSVTVTVESPTEGGSESVTLSPTGPGGTFSGTVVLAPGPGLPGDGVLQVAHGETITARYADADDGTGVPAEATASASVDAQAPVISGVTVSQIGTRTARVTFTTDEPSTAVVRVGTTCGSSSVVVQANSPATSHNLSLSGLQSATTYYLTIEAGDEAGNAGTDSNGGQCYAFTTLDAIDYLAEQFTSGDNDLDNQTFVFRPIDSVQGYQVCRMPAQSLPTNPSGGTVLSLSDDSFQRVTLSGGAQVSLFGTSYSAFYVGSNGYITFNSGSTGYSEQFSEHFSQPRISGLFDDLNPVDGGAVSWKQLADRVAVTWENVPEYNSQSGNTFQIELFFDGRIRITCLNIAASDGLIGLSRGGGIPADFEESDFSSYPECPPPDIELPAGPIVFTLPPNASATASIQVANTAADSEPLVYSASMSSPFGHLTTSTLSTGTSNEIGTNRYRGNIFEVTRSTRLINFEAELSFTGSVPIHYVVYESEISNGIYNRIFDRTVVHQGSGDRAFYSCGQMNVPLQAGRFYILAAGWGGGTSVRTYYNTGLAPAGTVPFGTHSNSVILGSFPASQSLQLSQLAAITWSQRLTTLVSWMAISPAVGEVPASQSRELLLEVSSTGLGQGTYPGTLEVRSSDPAQPLAQIPVMLQVLGLPFPVIGHNPPHQSIGQPLILTLSWNDGGGATSYDVYFGWADPPPFVGSTSDTRFDVGPLEPGRRYYWRVDPRNGVGSLPGDVMMFRTYSSIAASLDWSLYE